ncbi:MAG: alanine--glyoxylate aminotransferase family protein [Dehalococcoidales bacterium]|nr:alanine--glyoxylate aminotransferase family protein [Dehalococcoidales bacterium]
MAQLRIPGPTPCPEEVLKAMSRQMINHRGDEYAKLQREVIAKLKSVFQTQNDLYLLTGSGTGGMEAAIVNMLSPGDKVLAVTVGAFGDRFANIAKTYGADVTIIKSEFGKPADVAAIKKALQAEPKIKAIIVTHNESSTGLTNPLEEIAKIAKDAGKLIIVDAVSSMGAIDCPVDKWKLDVVVTGSQKSWMVPPGMAFVSISQDAWKAHAEAKIPRFYWDFTRAKKIYEEKGQNPWTPAVSIVFGLQPALDMILKEGLPNVFARHARIAKLTREGCKALGLTPFVADEKYASNTVTAITVNKGLDQKKLNKILRDEFQVVISGGQQALEGKIFRIGHLGWVADKDIKEVLDALKLALPKAGFGSAK